MQHDFSALAEFWWDPNGPLKTLHALQPVRTQFILELNPVWEGKCFLDLGCGGGLMTEQMARFGARAYGVDEASQLIKTAETHAALLAPLQAKGLVMPQYQVSDALDFLAQSAHLPDETGLWDGVGLFELLEHVGHPGPILDAALKRLKPGGHLYISTLNRTLKSFLLGIVAAEKILKLVPEGTHEYRLFIRPSEIERWAVGTREARVIGLRGIDYCPLRNRARFTQEVDVNYLMCVERIGEAA